MASSHYALYFYPGAPGMYGPTSPNRPEPFRVNKLEVKGMTLSTSDETAVRQFLETAISSHLIFPRFDVGTVTLGGSDEMDRSPKAAVLMDDEPETEREWLIYSRLYRLTPEGASPDSLYTYIACLLVPNGGSNAEDQRLLCHDTDVFCETQGIERHLFVADLPGSLDILGRWYDSVYGSLTAVVDATSEEELARVLHLGLIQNCASTDIREHPEGGRRLDENSVRTFTVRPAGEGPSLTNALLCFLGVTSLNHSPDRTGAADIDPALENAVLDGNSMDGGDMVSPTKVPSSPVMISVDMELGESARAFISEDEDGTTITTKGTSNICRNYARGMKAPAASPFTIRRYIEDMKFKVDEHLCHIRGKLREAAADYYGLYQLRLALDKCPDMLLLVHLLTERAGKRVGSIKKRDATEILLVAAGMAPAAKRQAPQANLLDNLDQATITSPQLEASQHDNPDIPLIVM